MCEPTFCLCSRNLGMPGTALLAGILKALCCYGLVAAPSPAMGLEIVEDPQAIQAALDAAAARQEALLREALKAIASERGGLAPFHPLALTHPERLRPAVEASLQRPTLRGSARLSVLSLAQRLGLAGTEQELALLLEGDDLALKRATLTVLAGLPADWRPQAAALQAALLKLLDEKDGNLQPAALRLAGSRGWPGLPDHLAALLARRLQDQRPMDDFSGLCRICFWLARSGHGAPALQGLEALVPAVLRGGPEGLPSCAEALTALLEAQPTPAPSAALSLVERFLELEEQALTGAPGARGSQALRLVFARRAGQAQGVFLERLCSQTQEAQTRRALFLALARIGGRGEAARQRLAQALEDPALRGVAAEALARYWRAGEEGGGDPALLARVRELAQAAAAQPRTRRTLLEACFALGGRAEVPWIVERAAALDPQDRFVLAWALNRRTPEGGWARFAEAGLPGAAPPDGEPPRAERPGEGDGSEAEAGVGRFLAGLARAGLLLRLEPPGAAPSQRYDELLGRFAAAGRGVFTPQACQQTGPRREAGEVEAEYTVEFVLAGKLFRFQARSPGGRCDRAAVARAANGSLERCGRKERFVGWRMGEGEEAYLLGEPERLRALAKEFTLPLVEVGPEKASSGGGGE